MKKISHYYITINLIGKAFETVKELVVDRIFQNSTIWLKAQIHSSGNKYRRLLSLQ